MIIASAISGPVQTFPLPPCPVTTTWLSASAIPIAVLAKTAYERSCSITSVAIKKRKKGEKIHNGGADVPPGLKKRISQRPPDGVGIPGSNKNWVGCRRREPDQGKFKKKGSKSSANLRFNE